MRSIIIFVENQQRLNYLQKENPKPNAENTNERFKAIQKSFRGDNKPSLISRIKSIFNNHE